MEPREITVIIIGIVWLLGLLFCIYNNNPEPQLEKKYVGYKFNGHHYATFDDAQDAKRELYNQYKKTHSLKEADLMWNTMNIENDYSN